MIQTLWDLITSPLRPAKPAGPAAIEKRKKSLAASSTPTAIRAPSPKRRGKSEKRRDLLSLSATAPVNRLSQGVAGPGGPGSLDSLGSLGQLPMRDRYEAVVEHMLAKYGVRVRKWRTSMSGIAWEIYYRDGATRRLIESPKPKGPMSIAIFLHEIGHHAIGFNVYKPRCLEEYHAWVFAIRAMEAHNLNITEAVRRRMARSLHYAIGKATRRGLRSLPPELLPYVEKPA